MSHSSRAKIIEGVKVFKVIVHMGHIPENSEEYSEKKRSQERAQRFPALVYGRVPSCYRCFSGSDHGNDLVAALESESAGSEVCRADRGCLVRSGSGCQAHPVDLGTRTPYRLTDSVHLQPPSPGEPASSSVFPTKPRRTRSHPGAAWSVLAVTWLTA
ncbi:hypothetical protein J6590_059197 [Homalodisca vitripennis]|nr:hypothetical protein J6590_059197 [Homalodisca vitripennis]